MFSISSTIRAPWSPARAFSLAYIAIPLALAALPCAAQDGVWKDVFNGTDLTGLKLHVNTNGTATASVVVPGVIEVNGSNGYLYTEKEYTHYRARVEWNNIGKGNSGYLHHINESKQTCTWPAGPELQMTRGDVGSIWTTDCKFNSKVKDTKYDETGTSITGVGVYGCGRQHFERTLDKEIRDNWNTWEIFVNGDSLEVMVNNVVVMRISKLTTSNNVPMVKGSMGLQIEGSKVQWRKWQVKDLTIPTLIATKADGKINLRTTHSDLRLKSGSGVLFGMIGLDAGKSRADAVGRKTPLTP